MMLIGGLGPEPQQTKAKTTMTPSGFATESENGKFPRPDKLTSLPEVVVYEDHHYGGHSHRTNLNFLNIGRDLNDRISSIVVVRGVWRFYRDPHYKGDYWDLGVGYYPSIGGLNDVISSFQCIDYDVKGE
jgi:hypothetical protein